MNRGELAHLGLPLDAFETRQSRLVSLLLLPRGLTDRILWLHLIVTDVGVGSGASSRDLAGAVGSLFRVVPGARLPLNTRTAELSLGGAITRGRVGGGGFPAASAARGRGVDGARAGGLSHWRTVWPAYGHPVVVYGLGVGGVVMWVRMSLSLSMSGWAVHGSLWPGDIPDGTVTPDSRVRESQRQ